MTSRTRPAGSSSPSGSRARRRRQRWPFAAVVVRDDELVATGVDRVTRDLDPTAHAEVVAIRATCAELGTVDLTG